MNNRRGYVSDYPEHLNPFREDDKLRFWKFGKTTRSGSFRDAIRNTLTLKSFRAKKKDKPEATHSPPEIRKHSSFTDVQHRQTFPIKPSPNYSPSRGNPAPPLPRFRFNERIAKSNDNQIETRLNNEQIPPSITEVPPSIVEVPPSPNVVEGDVKERYHKLNGVRRRKRRAPLPPNMTREEGDTPYLGVSSEHNLSKWSLTSVETDLSVYSENENSGLYVSNEDVSEIMNITKELEKMRDDTIGDNNCGHIKDENKYRYQSGIPDIIASSQEIIKEEAHTPYEGNDIPIDENSNVVSETVCDDIDAQKSSCDEIQNQECDSNRNVIFESTNIQTFVNDKDPPTKDLSTDDSFCNKNANGQLDTSVNLEKTLENFPVLNTDITPPISPKCKTEINIILSEAQDNETQDYDNKVCEQYVPKARTCIPTPSDLLGNGNVTPE